MHIKPAAGFSFLEVLIAMAVLTVVMVSLARLQAATTHAARQANARDLGQQFAAELAEEIREGMPVAALLAVSAEGAEVPAMSCYRQSCTPQQFVHFEWHEWRQRLLWIAPAARVSICRSEDFPLSGWQCVADDVLTAPLIIRIGWPLPFVAQEFPPAIAITVGPVPL